MRFFSRFGRFHKDFPLKEGTVRVPLPFSKNRPENHSHNLGKALAKGWVYSARLSLSLSLSPLYPFHLSIPFTSLSLSPLSLSLSLLSLPPSLYLLFYLSFSLSPSLSLLTIILFGVSNRYFRPCFYCRPKGLGKNILSFGANEIFF